MAVEHGCSATSHKAKSVSPKTENTVITPSKQERWIWEDSGDAQRAHLVLLGILAAGTIPELQEVNNIELFYFISLAVCTIYIGAHKGLTTIVRQQITFREVGAKL